MRRVFFIDVDGTITGKNGSILHDPQGRPTDVAASALVDLFKNGVKPVLVSSRNHDQLKEIGRLLGITDFISDFGAVIQAGSEKIYLADAAPVEKFKSEILPDLLQHFKGYLEKHEPWFDNARFTVMLRGCLKIEGEYLVKKVIEYLEQKGFQDWRMVDNGSTRRRTSLLCERARIFHIMPQGLSKLIAARRYLDITGKDALVFAAGDSPADLELAAISELFFFAGTEDELSSYAKYLDFFIDRNKIIVLNSKGPEALARAAQLALEFKR